jgi:hypothetical protein
MDLREFGCKDWPWIERAKFVSHYGLCISGVKPLGSATTLLDCSVYFRFVSGRRIAREKVKWDPTRYRNV